MNMDMKTINKYICLEKMGAGSFGEIYKGKHVKTDEFVAIKIEPISNNTKLLKNETKVYQYLQSLRENVGIPNVKWFGCDSINYYMVIDLLDESLETRRKKAGPFSWEDTYKYGIQMVERLKYIHSCGLMHRDVKPDNFLFGKHRETGEEILYLIDFGFCKKIEEKDKDADMKMKKKTTSIIGTPNYISLSVHDYYSPTPKDDLESVVYIMAFLHFENLPWDNPEFTNAQIREKKIQMFSNISPPFLQFIKNLLL